MILTSRGKCNFFISSKIFGEAVPGAPLFHGQLHFNWTGQGCARCERIDWNLSGYVRVLHNMHNCTWEDVVMHMGCAENLDLTKCLFFLQKFKSNFIPMPSQNKGKRELDNKFWWVLFFLPFEISVSTWVCGHFGQNLLPPILDFSTEGLSQNTAFQVQYNVNITCADEIQCMRGLFTPISTPK